MPGGGGFSAWSLPVVIDSTNKIIEFNETGNANNPLTATLVEGTYFWRNTLTGDDLVYRINLALNSAPNGTHSYVSQIKGDGKLYIADTTGTFDILWGGSTTFDRQLAGFDAGATSTASSVVSDFQVGSCWIPRQMTVDDSEEYPLKSSRTRMAKNGRRRTQQWGDVTLRDVEIDVLPPNVIYEAEETIENEAFQRFYDEVSTGTRFEYRPRMFVSETGVYSAPSDYGTYVIRDENWMNEWPVTMEQSVARRYNIKFPLQKYVS